MVSGDADPVGEYGKGVKKAYASMQAVGLENMKLRLYENNRHEPLNDIDRVMVMQDIYDWIRGTILV